MKKYCTKLIKEYVEKNNDVIESIYCGMREDWSWTAELIYENGEFLSDYNWNNENISVAGISGSTWATPVMEILFKDGRSKIISCWEDDKVEENEDRIRQQKMFASETGGMDYKF